MTPKEEVEALMNEGIAFATKLLSEHGEFFPFGVTMHSLGEIQYVAAYDGDEHPPSEEIANLLLAAFRDRATAGEYKATAIFINVTLRDQTDGSGRDAVQAGLDHLSGYSVNVFFPYSLSQSGNVEFDDLVATARESTIFDSSR